MTTRSIPGLFYLLLANVLLSGCATPPELIFEDPAFSVTVPEGWKAGGVKEATASRNFHRLNIQKKKGAAVAEVSVSWYDEILDLESTIAARMTSIEDARFFKVKFGEIEEGSYGKYESLRSRSNEKKWTVELQVDIYCFHANGKTFVIWTGDAVDDLEKNEVGFRLIEDSFSVR